MRREDRERAEDRNRDGFSRDRLTNRKWCSYMKGDLHR